MDLLPPYPERIDWKICMTVYTCNAGTQEVEVEESQVQGQSGLCSKILSKHSSCLGAGSWPHEYSPVRDRSLDNSPVSAERFNFSGNLNSPWAGPMCLHCLRTHLWGTSSEPEGTSVPPHTPSWSPPLATIVAITFETPCMPTSGAEEGLPPESTVGYPVYSLSA